jgi:translation initiation factor IF-3
MKCDTGHRHGLIFFFGSKSISQQKSQRLNSEINAPEIRLVGEEGEQLGIMSARQALSWQKKPGMDLVEIAPIWPSRRSASWTSASSSTRKPSEAHEAKLEAEADSGQGSEVPSRYRRERLPDQAAQLSSSCRKATRRKVTLRFRGREMAHQEFGMRMLERMKADLEQQLRWSSSFRRWKAGS